MPTRLGRLRLDTQNPPTSYVDVKGTVGIAANDGLNFIVSLRRALWRRQWSWYMDTRSSGLRGIDFE